MREEVGRSIGLSARKVQVSKIPGSERVPSAYLLSCADLVSGRLSSSDMIVLVA